MVGLGGAQQAPQNMGENPEQMGLGMEAAGQPEGLSDATPEEQALYNRFVSMAVLALSDEKLLPQTVKILQSGDDPVAAVAEVSSMMVRRVYDQAKGEGADIPGDILMHGGKEIVEYTIEIAEASGVAEFSPEMMEDAFYRAADLFTGSLKGSGDLNEEAMAQDLPQLKQMQESGAFDRMLAQAGEEQAAPSMQKEPV